MRLIGGFLVWTQVNGALELKCKTDPIKPLIGRKFDIVTNSPDDRWIRPSKLKLNDENLTFKTNLTNLGSFSC